MIRKRKGGTIGWRVEGGRQGRKNRWIWLPYTIILGFADVVVQLPSCVWLFATPWTAACQASLSLSISGVCPSSCLLHWSYYPAISSSDSLFSLCPQSFPASGTFPVNQLFISGDQNTGASASASIHEYSGFFSPSDWLVWSPCCPRDSQESSVLWCSAFFTV